MWSEAVVGLIGLIIGAVIGAGFDFFINERRMKFEAYKDVRVTLNNMHKDLVVLHSKIQRYNSENRDKDSREKIIDLRDYHWRVMEIYKEFRIYFGDLKTYELQSAIYAYYYEYSLVNQEDPRFNDFYDMAYEALKDAFGIMISEVKLGVVDVNFIKKVDDKLEKNKLDEYKKYSTRVYQTMEKGLKNDVAVLEKKDDASKLEHAGFVVKERIRAFDDEYKIKTKKDNKNQ